MSTMIRDNGRILRYAVLAAMADLRALYSWQSWSFVWLVRILCQVSMFALLGRMIGQPETVTYLLIGNAVFMVVNITMQVVNSTTWERLLGTLPLLVASPASPFTVYAGRSALWLVDGLGVGVVSLLLLAPLFEVALPMPGTLLAVLVIIGTALSTYCFGLLLAALSLRNVKLRALIASVGGLLLMLLTGVQVPTSYWPMPVPLLAQILPLTHGLAAVRGLLAGQPLSAVAGQIGLELLLGTGWLCLAYLAFRQYDRKGRHDATVDFDE